MFYPLRVAQAVVPDRHVDLLMYECKGIQHYTTIKNISRLVSGQLRNHGYAAYSCRKCLPGYSTPELLEAHAEDCCHVQINKFPEDPRCRFTNVHKQLPAPFVVYAVFESILKPENEDVDVTQGVDIGIESSSHTFQEHAPCSFAYKIVSSVDPDCSRTLVMYRGEDAAEMFVRKLQLEAKQLFLRIHLYSKTNAAYCYRITIVYQCYYLPYMYKTA